jgi:hypothetical protein
MSVKIDVFANFLKKAELKIKEVKLIKIKKELNLLIIELKIKYENDKR